MPICILIFLKTIGIFFISFLLIGVTAYSFVYFKFKHIFSIRGKTIHLQKPAVSESADIKKNSAKKEMFEKLISGEAFLRRLAYKNTSIKTDESFFDDSDMKSDYYLIIIYDKKSNIPLLTARYYFDKSVITKYLKGDDIPAQEPAVKADSLNIDKFKEGEIFLIDRMSANNNCSTYRQCRNYIHLLFYLELVTRNKGCKIIAMARKEKYEKLLAKYHRLGLGVVGATRHKSVEHWILMGDLKKCYSQLKMSTMLNIMLISKNLFFKLKTLK